MSLLHRQGFTSAQRHGTAHGAHHGLGVYGLGEEIVHAGVFGPPALFHQRACRQGHHGQLAVTQHIAEVAGSVEPVHHRHLHVHEHHIESGLTHVGQQVHRGLAIGRGTHPGPLALQQLGSHFPVQFAVVHQQHRNARQGQLVLPVPLQFCPQRCACGVGQGQRELYPETAALPRCAFQCGRTFHGFGQLLHYGQAQPRTPVAARGGRIGLAEGLEQTLLGAGCYAYAGVAHLEQQLEQLVAPQQLAGAHLHPPLGGELDGVAHQVGQNLADAARIAQQHAGERRVQHHRELQALGAGLGLVEGLELLQQRSQIEGALIERHLAGLDLGEVEHVVHDTQQRTARQLGLAHQLLLLGAQRRVLQQVGNANERIERRADFVAHVGQESALGVAGCLCTQAGFIERLRQHGLRTLALGKAVHHGIEGGGGGAHFVPGHIAHPVVQRALLDRIGSSGQLAQRAQDALPPQPHQPQHEHQHERRKDQFLPAVLSVELAAQVRLHAREFQRHVADAACLAQQLPHYDFHRQIVGPKVSALLQLLQTPEQGGHDGSGLLQGRHLLRSVRAEGSVGTGGLQQLLVQQAPLVRGARRAVEQEVLREYQQARRVAGYLADIGLLLQDALPRFLEAGQRRYAEHRDQQRHHQRGGNEETQLHAGSPAPLT